MSSGQTNTENRPSRYSLRSLLAIVSILALSMAICLPLIRPSSADFDADYVSFFLLSTLLSGLGLSVWFRSWTVFGSLIALALFFSLFLTPLVRFAEPSRKRPVCQTNLKQQGLALHNIEYAFKTFPATSGTDKDPQFPYSWRVAILPYIEQQGLYDQYRFDEPWDGPNNSKLASLMPKTFQCPTHRNKQNDFTTPYVAITGPGTMFPEDRPGVFRRDCRIGQSNMIAIIECPDHAVHWMKPDDLSLAEAIALYSPSAATSPTASHSGGCNAARCDGSVGFHAFNDVELLAILQAMREAVVQGEGIGPTDKPVQSNSSVGEFHDYNQ